MVRERQGVSFGDDRLSAGETGLVIFDMLECYRDSIEEAGTLPNVVKLVNACRASELPVFFARADHRADGRDFALTMSDTDSHFKPWGPANEPPTVPPFGSGSPMLSPLKELGMSTQDFDIPKHRWSAFAGTALDATLRTLGISTILLVGGSTHVGVASTAFAARDMDYQVTVVRDGCHGFAEQREFFLNHVFPRMCRVRTVDEVIAKIVP
ncbi:MAG: cysteine hydrolase [Acidimicrobiaceae bacterium]|nr:cysteine hydrolase [Acidimicrobiaceae bacterium]